MTSIPEKGALCSAELISGLINGTLSHHGIKGMRWGVRRFQNKDGSLTPAGKKRYGSADVKAGSSPERSKPSLLRGKSGGGKKLSEMTDAELDARINRLKKEQTYRDLVGQMTRTKEGRAKRVIFNALESLAKRSADALIDKFINSAIKGNSGNNPNQKSNSNSSGGSITINDLERVMSVVNRYMNSDSGKTNRKNQNSNQGGNNNDGKKSGKKG